MADINGTTDLPSHRRATRAGYVLATSARGASLNMKSSPRDQRRLLGRLAEKVGYLSLLRTEARVKIAS